MPISVEELEHLMALPSEGEHLEFKEAKNQFDTTKLLKYCVALANEGGGKLILGVTDQAPRKVVGTQAFLQLNEIKAKLLDRLRIYVEAEELPHPSGRVVAFIVPSRPPATPVEFEGSYWMRAGDSLVPMTNDRLRKIFAEGNPDFLSQPAVGGLSDQEVVSKLDTQIYYDLLQSPFPSQRDEVLERFTKEGLIRRSEGRYEITNLGAILFAKNLQEFDRVSSKAPRVLVYESRDRLSARSDLIGSKGYAIAFESLINYIHSQTSLNEEIGRALRRDVRMYPAISIRELVANTLIHQDFNEIGSSVRIEIYPDRIEFTSPGTPFISTDRFIDEDQARNERLADPQPPPSPL